ncbi:MAG: hypothetical protein ACRD3Q_07995 [Terriglobales bacterium]
MKSIATTALAALMLLGTVSAIASSNKALPGDGGPVPLCNPGDPCSPIPPSVKSAKVALPGDGGPVPLCNPGDPCSPIPPSVR